MNIFASFVPEGPSYFRIFTLALFDDDLATFWKVICMSPTGILLVLTILHIMEPRSSSITRNHLALAAIFGFVLYMIIYGLMYLATALAIDAGDLLSGMATGQYSESDKPSLGVFGWSAVLYPILFLSYVIIHRFMKYETPEVDPNFRRISRSKTSNTRHDEDEYV